MASSYDPPFEPKPGVVDAGVLEQRRARREDPSARAEIERLRAQALLDAQRSAELEAEVALLTGELDRRTAEHAAITAQVARLRSGLASVRERAGGEEAHQAATTELMARLRTGQELLGRALEELRLEHARAQSRLSEERSRRGELELLVADERARFAAELARTAADARAERDALARSLEQAQRTVAALAAQVDAADVALGSSGEPAARQERDAVVERLVAELIGSVEGLRAGFVAELDALESERAALLASSGDEAVVRADHLRAEVERLRRATRPPEALPERRPGGVPIPPADHPALAGTSPRPPAVAAPGVVGDLDRAAARLRAERALPAEAEELPPDGFPDGAPEQLTPDVPADGELPADAEAAEADTPVASTAPAVVARPASTAGLLGLAEAMARLAADDPAVAERVLLAALVVQGPRAGRDVAYELELERAGRHHVAVARDGPVVVTRLIPGQQRAAEFSLAGPVAALAPLVTGGSSRRLAGVAVRGRRRRLRRLLRALRTEVGLPELTAAGARLEPHDLLALLCARVPGDRADVRALRVAYVVGEPAATASRIVVEATPAGVGPLVDAGPEDPVDATVSVTPEHLLAVLTGAAPASVTGDADAVAALHGWLRPAGAPSA